MSVLLLCASVVLGGGTRAGVTGDVLLQLLSIPLLLAGLWIWIDCLANGRAWRDRLQNPTTAIGCAIAAMGGIILIAQFLPILGSAASNGIWNEVIRRGGEAAAPLTGTGTSSLAPDLSAAAIAAILPALTLFLLVALLDRTQRMRLAGWSLLLGAVSLALGVLQVLSGTASPLRFHWPTNTLEAVGFFANRNHFAAQMYATLLLGIAWLTHRWQGRFSGPRFTAEKAQALGIAVSFALLVLGGIALARSRAGILLTFLAFIPLVAVAPSILGMLTGRRIQLGTGRMKAGLAIGAVILVIGVLGAERILPRFDASILSDLRGPIAATTTQALLNALPSGTGLGTFVPVYQTYEPDGNLLLQYINRAHNDWVEFVLEAGLPGVLLILLFLGWLGLRAWPIWTANRGDLRASDRLLERLASLVILMLLLHSFLDYPLRTSTMMAYFALCCGLLTPTAAEQLTARAPRASGKTAARGRHPRSEATS